jgi:hypothetical protein
MEVTVSTSLYENPVFFTVIRLTIYLCRKRGAFGHLWGLFRPQYQFCALESWANLHILLEVDAGIDISIDHSDRGA